MDSLLTFDRELFFLINHGLHAPALDPVMWFFTSLGLGQVQVALVLLWAGVRRWLMKRGNLTENSPAKPILLPALIAFIGSGLTTQLIKRVWSRPRPSNLEEALVAPDEQIFARSFPSGHTTTTFALAAFVWWFTRGTRWAWVGWAAWGIAFLVGLSRIYRGVHYPLDTLVGACIGVIWCALAVWWVYRKR